MIIGYARTSTAEQKDGLEAQPCELEAFGIAAAKEAHKALQRGDEKRKYGGQIPTARAKAAEIPRLAAEGVTREANAKRLGIGVASAYRVLAETKQQAAA